MAAMNGHTDVVRVLLHSCRCRLKPSLSLEAPVGARPGRCKRARGHRQVARRSRGGRERTPYVHGPHGGITALNVAAGSPTDRRCSRCLSGLELTSIRSITTEEPRSKRRRRHQLRTRPAERSTGLEHAPGVASARFSDPVPRSLTV